MGAEVGNTKKKKRARPRMNKGRRSNKHPGHKPSVFSETATKDAFLTAHSSPVTYHPLPRLKLPPEVQTLLCQH